ncbi:Meteorin-like protein [Dirofilaria immitis]
MDFISGGSDDKIIQKLNLSCKSGYLQWDDPIGGMHVRFLMKNTNKERICLRIHFMPVYKISYHISDGNNHYLLNVTKEFQKCMNISIDITLFIEAYKMQIWKQRIAAFRYQILPESSLISNEKISCDNCSSIDIMNAFCNYADFVFEGHQSNANDHILIDKILRRPLHHHQIIEKRNNQSILKAPVFGCLYKKDEINRIYIAKMEFDTNNPKIYLVNYYDGIRWINRTISTILSA